MSDRPAGLGELERILLVVDRVAIALSGGVDSMTLAHVAMSAMPVKPLLFHALSSAVPASATVRVRDHAERWGWSLKCVDAGELDDSRYASNPLNRCYFCKSKLYDYIRREWSGPLFSGTNCDDLSDYRPGLIAAKEHDVRHPFVEAGIDKAGIRTIATYLGLDDIAGLPAQPCLSSRIETGIPIDSGSLLLIDQIETRLREVLGPVDVRCRLRKSGLHVEIDGGMFERLDSAMLREVGGMVQNHGARVGIAFGGIAPYVRGSAFVGATAYLAQAGEDEG